MDVPNPFDPRSFPSPESRQIGGNAGERPIGDRLSALSQGQPSQGSSTQANRTQLSREQILDATGRCFREFGYDKTTIRRIASLLDCAVGSIYRYFKDKRELLFAVTQQTLDPVLEAIRRGEAFEQTQAMYFRIAATDPVAYRLMFWLASLGPEVSGPASGGASEAGSDAGTDAGIPASNALAPPIIRDIIGAWSQQIGDADAAIHRWSVLHGALAMGASPTQMPATDGTPGKSSYATHATVRGNGQETPAGQPAPSMPGKPAKPDIEGIGEIPDPASDLGPRAAQVSDRLASRSMPSSDDGSLRRPTAPPVPASAPTSTSASASASASGGNDGEQATDGDDDVCLL